MRWYRCAECKTVVSQKDISSGKGCRKCKGMRVKCAELSFGEKIVEGFRWPKMFFNLENYKEEI